MDLDRLYDDLRYVVKKNKRVLTKECLTVLAEVEKFLLKELLVGGQLEESLNATKKKLHDAYDGVLRKELELERKELELERKEAKVQEVLAQLILDKEYLEFFNTLHQYTTPINHLSGGQMVFTFGYDVYSGEVYIFELPVEDAPVIIFSSLKEAKKAVSVLGKEAIKKHCFRVA